MRIIPLLAVALMLAGSPALAQEAAPPGEGMHHHQFDKKHFDTRLADLELKLQLTAAQKPLWDNFAGVIRAHREAMMAHFKDHMRDQESLDAPARLDRRLKMLNLQIADLQQTKQALAPLWATLNPGQRAILNDVAWHPHHPMGPHRPWDEQQ